MIFKLHVFTKGHSFELYLIVRLIVFIFIFRLISYELYVLLALLVITTPIILLYIEGPHLPVSHIVIIKIS